MATTTKPFIINPSASRAMRTKTRTHEARRMKAARLFDQGLSQAEVARRLGVTRTAAHYWHSAWEQDGANALKAKRPGPKPQLTRDDIATIRQTLTNGPRKAGYPTELWTLARVAKVIKKRTRASLSESQVWNVLRAMGWSAQKPETRYRDRDEKSITHWRKKLWPQTQKKGPRSVRV